MQDAEAAGVEHTVVKAFSLSLLCTSVKERLFFCKSGENSGYRWTTVFL